MKAIVAAYGLSDEAGIAALGLVTQPLREANKRRHDAIMSLTHWLLHRFGPDTPEGREANTALMAIRPDDGFAASAEGKPDV